MAIKFSIGKKITTGYTVLALITAVCMVLSVLMLRQAQDLDNELLEVYIPVSNHLNDLSEDIPSAIEYSERLIQDKRSTDQEKLKYLVTQKIAAVRNNLDSAGTRYSGR